MKKHLFIKGDRQAKEPYDAEHLIPAVRRSICTGERVAGFIDRRNDRFSEVMLIRSPKDEQRFKEQYHVGSLKEIY